jgi:hypothetical protein
MGYSFMILAKIQVFLMLDLKDDETSVFWGLIAGEIAFFLLWIFRKLLFPTLQNISVPPSYQAKQLKLVPSVSSINGTHELMGCSLTTSTTWSPYSDIILSAIRLLTPLKPEISIDTCMACTLQREFQLYLKILMGSRQWNCSVIPLPKSAFHHSTPA